MGLEGSKEANKLGERIDKYRERFRKNIIYAIDDALGEFYGKDSYLVSAKPNENEIEYFNEYLKNNNYSDCTYVGERAIQFRFAHYLQNCILRDKIFEGFDLDCEYNRNYRDPKTVEGKLIYPDIIIHKRGSNAANLCVIELKTYWNSNNDSDIEKLKKLTNKMGIYKYMIGVSVIFEKTLDKCRQELVENGDIIKTLWANKLNS